jgi:acyl-coenzyme A synthetase/AMP-(fatty) acid ligase
MTIGTAAIGETIASIVARRQREVFLLEAITHREITYGEFHRRACALAAHLQLRGLRRGDRVAVMMPNCCDLAVLYFACIYLGAVIVPVNPSLSQADVHFILRSSSPSLLIASPSYARSLKESHPNVLAFAAAHESPPETLIEGKALPTIHLEFLPEAPHFHPLADAQASDLIVIMYTSGTSATPKGLAHSIGSMLRNATAFAATQQLDQGSRFYLTLSMAYMGGFYNLLILPFLCGASVVVDHVFDARSSLNFWDKARQLQVNTLWMAPTVLSILLRMDRGRVGEEFCRTSVRHVFVGFAPLPLKVKDEFESRYGVRLIQNYGLSETLFVTARTPGLAGSCGYVGESLPGVAVRIVNDNGDPMPPHRDGEIQILTPDLMAGYLDARGQLLPIEPSTWFPAGDVGQLDESGSLSITGRKKDIIIRGGVNISPAAIEESLLQVNGVADVAVVSVAHELYGEDIVAVLRLEPGVELESLLDALIAHARNHLAQHQQPARYLSIDEFPRTANGKVQKTRLRELVAQKFHNAATSHPRRTAAERAITPLR